MNIDTELIGTIAWIVAASIGILLACIFTWEIRANIGIKKQEQEYNNQLYEKQVCIEEEQKGRDLFEPWDQFKEDAFK